MTGTIRDRAKNGGQGMRWIRHEKRLALYLRDGLSCAYCGYGIEDGAQLTLDHLMPHSQGGSNEATNLVTCCMRCNSSRGNRDYRQFAAAVAAYVNHDVTTQDILTHITTTVQRPFNVAAAKALIAQRGSFAQALHN